MWYNQLHGNEAARKDKRGVSAGKGEETVKIACVGDNCIDYYRETGKMYPGGNAVNVAGYIRRLGEESAYIGPVGDDAFGKTITDALREKGVDVSHVRVEDGSTAVSYVAVQDGERVFTGFEEGVMADFRPREDDIDFICAHDMAVAGVWGHAESALPAIRERGIPTAYDASEDPFGPTAQSALPHSVLFFFSAGEIGEEELREKLRMLREGGADMVIATRGGQGSMVYDGKDFYAEGIVPVEVVDTMGAGDSYIAGFVVAWLKGLPVQACMRAGAENAAVTIGYSGA